MSVNDGESGQLLMMFQMHFSHHLVCSWLGLMMYWLVRQRGMRPVVVLTTCVTGDITTTRRSFWPLSAVMTRNSFTSAIIGMLYRYVAHSVTVVCVIGWFEMEHAQTKGLCMFHVHVQTECVWIAVWTSTETVCPSHVINTSHVFAVIYTEAKNNERSWHVPSQINLSHKRRLLNVQHNLSSVMCYTVLIWTLILFTLGKTYCCNNLIDLNHYVPTGKINASIRICIRRILIVSHSHSTNANFDQLRHITTVTEYDVWWYIILTTHGLWCSAGWMAILARWPMKLINLVN